MAQAIDRRQFLRGDFTGKHFPVRPPWSLAEQDFLNLCTRCGSCVKACPESILVETNGQYPEVDFNKGECTFCASCLEACETGALKKSDIPWYLILSIGPDCLARRDVVCSVCAEQCDTRAIRFKPAIGSVALPETDQSLCSGCGACIQACPSRAMYLSKQLSTEGTSI